MGNDSIESDTTYYNWKYDYENLIVRHNGNGSYGVYVKQPEDPSKLEEIITYDINSGEFEASAYNLNTNQSKITDLCALVKAHIQSYQEAGTRIPETFNPLEGINNDADERIENQITHNTGLPGNSIFETSPLPGDIGHDIGADATISQTTVQEPTFAQRPAALPPKSPEVPASIGSGDQLVRHPCVDDIQTALEARGFSVGECGIDGICGPDTRAGLAQAFPNMDLSQLSMTDILEKVKELPMPEMELTQGNGDLAADATKSSPNHKIDPVTGAISSPVQPEQQHEWLANNTNDATFAPS